MEKRKSVTVAFVGRSDIDKELKERVYSGLCELASRNRRSMSNQALLLMDAGLNLLKEEEFVEEDRMITNLPVVIEKQDIDIVAIKNVLYDILESGDGISGNGQNQVIGEQLQNISMTRAMAEKKSVNVFQIQNIVFTQITAKISKVLRLLDRS